ncbi:hypothetical protein GCM10017567_08160 [Amycolatopsis bullii]|uniref:Uncharacterized protein n=1 Tax=Amycolatopsis bullii TaxID=941987 RepID=A0ABQ3K1S2_9PSEU|nr:hypothetical protein GCM10017567_08160 [Amycolatopsis bullii]
MSGERGQQEDAGEPGGKKGFSHALTVLTAELCHIGTFTEIDPDRVVARAPGPGHNSRTQ